MNSGFANLRASLPMNLKGKFPGHKVWANAQPDIDRIVEIWTIITMPEMQEWVAAAKLEPDEIEELDMDF